MGSRRQADAVRLVPTAFGEAATKVTGRLSAARRIQKSSFLLLILCGERDNRDSLKLRIRHMCGAYVTVTLDRGYYFLSAQDVEYVSLKVDYSSVHGEGDVGLVWRENGS